MNLKHQFENIRWVFLLGIHSHILVRVVFVKDLAFYFGVLLVTRSFWTSSISQIRMKITNYENYRQRSIAIKHVMTCSEFMISMCFAYDRMIGHSSYRKNICYTKAISAFRVYMLFMSKCCPFYSMETW